VNLKGITARSAKLGGTKKKKAFGLRYVFLECGSVILLVDPVPRPTCDWKKLGLNLN